MILSHTVKGLLTFPMLPDFAVVPVHLVTKFSSTLFIIVFGLSVAVAYLPRAGTHRWPEVRRGLWIRALFILVSFKLLTVVQMFEHFDREIIIETLLWKRFPDFAEILDFYTWAVLLLSLLLPMWKRLTLWQQLGTAWGLALLAMVLQQFEFGGAWQIKALLVEQRGAFTFGIFTRGSMVLFALAIGEWVWSDALRRDARVKTLGTAALVVGLSALGYFFVDHWDNLGNITTRLAKNYGKHPPNEVFLLFSVGGALLVLGLVLKLDGAMDRVLWPLQMLGRQSLFCFNAHLLILFLGFRWTLGLRHEVSYGQALALTLANVVLCTTGAWGWERLKNARKVRHAHAHKEEARAEEEEWQDRTEVVPIPVLVRDRDRF